jgi:general secretion pathway protein B
MSFILDALKKSENDRQRQSGPALYEVKVAAPRSQLPYWAIGLIVLLGINLVIVAWALLRRPSHATDAQSAAAAAPAPAVPNPAANAANGYAPQSAPPAAAPPSALPGGPQGTLGTPTGYAQQAPEQAPPPPQEPSTIAQTGSRGAQEAGGDAAPNPDDYAPATDPAPSQGPGFHARRGTEAGVPLYSQIATSPGSGIPELRLDLHAWDERPENRFVLINMKKLREGDTLPEGVKVEAITRDGVILSHSGTKFLLPH